MTVVIKNDDINSTQKSKIKGRLNSFIDKERNSFLHEVVLRPEKNKSNPIKRFSVRNKSSLLDVYGPQNLLIKVKNT